MGSDQAPCAAGAGAAQTGHSVTMSSSHLAESHIHGKALSVFPQPPATGFRTDLGCCCCASQRQVLPLHIAGSPHCRERDTGHRTQDDGAVPPLIPCCSLVACRARCRPVRPVYGRWLWPVTGQAKRLPRRVVGQDGTRRGHIHCSGCHSRRPALMNCGTGPLRSRPA